MRRKRPVLSQPVTRPPEQPRAFVLPEANRCATAAVSYLQRRGIDSEIISRCMKAGIFYESRNYHNCVFVGRDRAGKARFACMRGTMGDFKADAPGSDKRFNFCLPSADPSSVLLTVFESPIDALSLATLRKVKRTAWDKCNYLSLGGTAPLALLQFLKDHPEIKQVYLCLDNDKAGLDGMARIEAAIKDDKELQGRPLNVERKPPLWSMARTTTNCCGQSWPDGRPRPVAPRKGVLNDETTISIYQRRMERHGNRDHRDGPFLLPGRV